MEDGRRCIPRNLIPADESIKYSHMKNLFGNFYTDGTNEVRIKVNNYIKALKDNLNVYARDKIKYKIVQKSIVLHMTYQCNDRVRDVSGEIHFVSITNEILTYIHRFNVSNI